MMTATILAGIAVLTMVAALATARTPRDESIAMGGLGFTLGVLAVDLLLLLTPR